MLAIPGATIHTLMRLMEDGKPFKQYMDQLDGSAQYFFETEFFHPSFTATKKQVLRRLWGVLSTPAFERMFTQPKNKIDLFEAMNDGKPRTLLRDARRHSEAHATSAGENTACPKQEVGKADC